VTEQDLITPTGAENMAI